ncbi:MAG: hypothetical protein JXA54_15990 [Candidatus Heimdallarchaeota archaeon]|nr:hypothetical protein [Candidatus Heimdallarchaeota archaeon]
MKKGFSSYRLLLAIFLLLVLNISFIFTIESLKITSAVHLNNVFADDSSIYIHSNDPIFVSAFDFDFDSVNNLHLVYNEQQVNYNKLIYKKTGSYYQWNLTRQIIAEENNSLAFFGTPSLEITTNKVWFVTPFEKGSSQGVILYSKDFSSNTWRSQIILSKESTSVSSPLIQKVPDKNAFLFAWKDNHEGSFNFYTMYYNITTQQLNNLSRITSNSGFYCSNMKFVFDSENDIHFVWSEGENNYEQILYRKIYQNGTMEAIEYLTDGANRCKYPAIIQDSQRMINVFWTNYTKINPGTEYGTININTAKKYSIGNWSAILDVAPYIPLDRPPGTESDAEKPTVTLDKENNLWLAYEIREQYLNHIGVDIRHRSILGWQNGEKVSLLSNSAIDPLIKADNAGNLHCMWLDIRFGSYEILYRIKFITGIWSDEIRLSLSTTSSFEAIYAAIIALSIIVALSLPFFILRRLKVKRDNQQMQRKLRDLDD